MTKKLLLGFIAFYALPAFSQTLFVPGGFSSSGIGTSSSTAAVGIGTSSPGAQLHLKNPAVYNGGSYVFMKFENRHYNTAYYTALEIGTSSFDPFINLYNANSPSLFTRIGANSAYFCGSVTFLGDLINGNNTINSTSNYKILANGNATFNGKVTAKEITVKLNVWADYVLKNNYRLSPLCEVESYIYENNRLPGLPSEKEVLDNGVNLGEMNVLLLKKIEELTLYIIEQNKRIETLEKKY